MKISILKYKNPAKIFTALAIFLLVLFYVLMGFSQHGFLSLISVPVAHADTPAPGVDPGSGDAGRGDDGGSC